MSKKVPGKTDISHLMPWDGAADACNEVWDIFAEEFHKNIDAKISGAEVGLSFDPNASGGFTAAEKVLEKQTALELCKSNFDTAFPSWREHSLNDLREGLLKQTKRRKAGAVSSRHKPKKGGASQKTKVHHRKRGPKPKKVNAHKRKHRKTGRKRGWNNARWVLPHNRAGNHPTVRDLRKRRSARRRAQRIDRNVKRALRVLRFSKRFKRHWRPYPRTRGFSKWMKNWLRAKAVGLVKRLFHYGT